MQSDFIYLDSVFSSSAPVMQALSAAIIAFLFDFFLPSRIGLCSFFTPYQVHAPRLFESIEFDNSI